MTESGKPTDGPRVMVVGATLLQEALATLLERRCHVETLAPGAADEVAATVGRASPNIVLLELTPDARRMAVLHALLALRPAPRTVLVSNHATVETIRAALDAGANACVSTEGGVEELWQALEAARENRRFLGPLIGELMESPGAIPDQGPSKLTAREHQVLTLIAQGNTDRTIAKQLGISPRTVHTYRTSVMSKLRVHNVIALVRRALELGLVYGVLIAPLVWDS